MDPKRRYLRALRRFRDKYVIKESGCWEWQAHKIRGYGRFSFNCKGVSAHRFAYELYKGKIPDGLQLDHLCRNPACVNPEHLEVVTAQVNNLRGIGPAAQNVKKTHCVRGHPLTPDNLQVKNGHRICLECRKLYNRDTYARLYSSAANGGVCKRTLEKNAS